MSLAAEVSTMPVKVTTPGANGSNVTVLLGSCKSTGWTGRSDFLVIISNCSVRQINLDPTKDETWQYLSAGNISSP